MTFFFFFFTKLNMKVDDFYRRSYTSGSLAKLTLQGPFPPVMSPAHSMSSVSSGFFCLHSLWGMMWSFSCCRISGYGSGSIECGGGSEGVLLSLCGWVKEEDLSEGHTVGPNVPPANDPAIGGRAEDVTGLWQLHRGNIFWEFDLFLQFDQSDVVYIAVVWGFVARVSHKNIYAHISNRCLLQAVRANPDHRQMCIRPRLPAKPKTVVLHHHVDLSEALKYILCI